MSGRKFGADGTVNPFAGSTIICHLPQHGKPQDGLFLQILKCYKRFPGYSFSKKVTMLPTSSLHMTIFDILHEFQRKSETWPSDLPRDSSMETCNKWLIEKIKDNYDPSEFKLPIKMRVDRSCKLVHNLEATWKLPLMPYDESEREKLISLRASLSRILGIPVNKPDNYQFHITIGYTFTSLTEEEFQELDLVSTQLQEDVSQNVVLIELGDPEICSFDDMFHFDILGHIVD